MYLNLKLYICEVFYKLKLQKGPLGSSTMVVHELAAQPSMTLNVHECPSLKITGVDLVFCWISLLTTHVISIRDLKQVKWLSG